MTRTRVRCVCVIETSECEKYFFVLSLQTRLPGLLGSGLQHHVARAPHRREVLLSAVGCSRRREARRVGGLLACLMCTHLLRTVLHSDLNHRLNHLWRSVGGAFQEHVVFTAARAFPLCASVERLRLRATEGERREELTRFGNEPSFVVLERHGRSESRANFSRRCRNLVGVSEDLRALYAHIAPSIRASATRFIRPRRSCRVSL